MRDLVKGLVTRRRTRRDFLTQMVAAGYTLSAARSALASVSPFVQDGQTAESLTRTMTGTGGELLAEQLIEAGAKYMFVSNGSGLGPLCDALVTRPQIQFIQATHEGQVVAIADGYAKASGKIGFGMYSRIGLPHSSANMYNSMKDRTAVVLLSDHADTDREGTDAHEDIDDWLETVQQFTKWRWVAHQAERIPEWVRQACKVATVMPNGPAYVRIPRDLMYREGVTAAIFKGEAFRIPMELRPDTAAVERAARVLLESSSPLLYVGPEVSQSGGRGDLVQLAELLGIPVVQHRSFYADFPTTHPLHVGEYSANMRFPAKFDCLVNFGARAPVRVPAGTAIIHAGVDPMTIGRNSPLRVGLLGDLGQVARDLAEAIKSLAPADQLRKRGETRLAEAKAYTSKVRTARMALARRASGSPVPWQRLVVELNDQLDKDAVIVEELGTEGKVLNFFDFADDAKLKIGRTEGRSLGWGTGAAAGVQLALPRRQVVSLQGDGGMLFGQTDSLWTHSRYDLPILTVIFNNRSYEEVRWNIMGAGGASGKAGRDYISYLGNPDVDFTKLASAYNIDGAVVKTTDELQPAIQRAVKTIRGGRPFMLDVHIQNTGVGAEMTWYPKFSLAAERERLA
jgi:thiamine pyrophosphate-dependent acetolactate synthase large subunit-like protein